MNKELQVLFEECQYPDWDGYSALPVQQVTLINALNFISFSLEAPNRKAYQLPDDEELEKKFKEIIARPKGAVSMSIRD